MFKIARQEILQENRFITRDDIAIQYCGDQCILKTLPELWEPVKLGTINSYALTAEDSLWISISNKQRNADHVLGAFTPFDPAEKIHLFKKLKEQKHNNVLTIEDACTCSIRVPILKGTPLADMNMTPAWLKGTEDQFNQITAKDMYTVILDLAKGLNHLHKNELCHGDPFPFNAIYTTEKIAVWIDLQDAVPFSDDMQENDVIAFWIYIINYMHYGFEYGSASLYSKIMHIYANEEVSHILPSLIELLSKEISDIQSERAASSYSNSNVFRLHNDNELFIRKDAFGKKLVSLMTYGLSHWQRAFEWNVKEAQKMRKLLEMERTRHRFLENEIFRSTQLKQEEQMSHFKEELTWRKSEQDRLLLLLEDKNKENQRLETENNELQQRNNLVNTELRELRTKLEESRDKLEESRVKLDDSWTKFEESRSEMENRLIEVQSDHESRLSDLVTEKTNQEKQLLLLQKEIEILNGKLHEDTLLAEKRLDDLIVRFENVVAENAWRKTEQERLLSLLDERNKTIMLLESNKSILIKSVKMSKKLVKRALKTGFEYGKQKVSPETKQKLKPHLSRLYYTVYPEKKLIVPKSGESNQLSAHNEIAASVVLPSLNLLTNNREQKQAYFQSYSHEKVSVILPVYNHADMLDKSIKSVLEQTYPNIELIILNDGSTDGIEKVLDRYVNHPKIKILTQRNQKLPRALTNAFFQATGDLLTWTSADNICKPEMIEKLVMFMRVNPDVDLVYANYELIDENGYPLIGTDHRYHNQIPKGSNLMSLPKSVETLGLIEDNFIGASFMYRSHVAKIIGEYDPCLVGTEDYDYWLRINELFTVKRYDHEESLYYYRVHSNSLSEKFGKSHINDNVPKLIQYHKQRTEYYKVPFDVFFLAGKELHLGTQQLVRGYYENKTHVNLVAEADLLQKFPLPIQKINIHELASHNEKVALKALVFLDESYDKQTGALEWVKQTYPDQTFVISFNGEQESVDWTLQTGNEGSVGPECERIFIVEESLDKTSIIRKARDNKYYLWDYNGTGEKILGYFGPLRKNHFDVEYIKHVALLRPSYDIVIIGMEGESDYDFKAELGDLPNVYLLGNKPSDLQYYYLSGMDLFILPVLEGDRVYKKLALEALLHAGKPILTRTSLSNWNLPYVIWDSRGENIGAELDLLLCTEIDLRLVDKYLHWFLAENKAEKLESLANNVLFYRNTREAEKQAIGVIEEPARLYQPTRINLLIEALSLDKGGLEEVIFNVITTIDKEKYNPIIACIHTGGLVADRCKELGYPVIILSEANKEVEYLDILQQHNIHLVHQHYSTFGARLCWSRNIPVIHFLHNSYVWFTNEDVSLLANQDPYITSYIAVSQEVKDYSVKRVNLPAHKIKVIPNGISVEWLTQKFMQPQISFRSNFGLAEDDYVLLNLASIDGRKAQLLTIHVMNEVVKQHPNIKVLMCGNILDHSYYQKCKESIEKFGLENNVIFTGFVANNQDLFKIADVFLMPSIIEGWSISKTEAMFAELPLLLTDVGGAKHVVENEDIGIIIPNAYGDVAVLNDQTLYSYTLNGTTQNFQELKEAILRMYAEKDVWRERGKKGKEKVLENYDLLQIVKEYEKVSESTITSVSQYRSVIL
ncbi:glycosyltransferase [Brevibacillus sp. HB1.1]|uniref:glycosyltransferase n=1 Tax=Brevibacillus sp. HB1.1 TaxID=2738808 RepID=UPI0015757394|nr:glycosyltransferase [Brevibacillus sp. HB1.1]NTU31097.1 glycosyltransferase [Brevibacillus sp. HB1.1]